MRNRMCKQAFRYYLSGLTVILLLAVVVSTPKSKTKSKVQIRKFRTLLHDNWPPNLVNIS